MNMTYDITYAEVTPESATEGSFSDTGFEKENMALEVRDGESLVMCVARMLHVGGFFEPSCSEVDDSTYFTTDPEVDFSTGTERIQSIHFTGLPAGTLAQAWALVQRKWL